MLYLPDHLKKYIVEQDQQNYTAQDQAVWRYIMRQLKNYLSKHAHECYLDGLEKTGISVNQIPRVEDISNCLQKFGWRALPVSGFIPPAAFMELQSLSILPIATDMRSINHLLYTPAPDIVHEAAGHAPIIANEEYSNYLKLYAQIAKKSLISKEDLELYKAIRELSDIKENPKSDQQQIQLAELNLQKISQNMSFVSEAAELARMNWWTAEYGLIGDLNSPRIFGAGLLSSVGESRWCLSDEVKKIPLTLDCIKFSYDITEPQPQLFVARDFQHLASVLDEFSQTMAYQVGGAIGLNMAVQAATVNTVEFENKLQVSGVVTKYFKNSADEIIYLQLTGPTQICFNGQQINGHGPSYHQHGYSTPIGEIFNFNLQQLLTNTHYHLIYKSGVKVQGILTKIQQLSPQATILSFTQATCHYENQILFQPDWGTYDILIAHEVTSVFGGPADRLAFGDLEDFVAARIEKPLYTDEQNKVFMLYQNIRTFRENKTIDPQLLKKYWNDIQQIAAQDWLLHIELLEISHIINLDSNLVLEIEQALSLIKKVHPDYSSQITEGIKLSNVQS